jgi:hypothetical protein
VRLLKPTSFFETFAASIRHLDRSDGGSDMLYEFNFSARPSYLRPLLHPIMLFLLRMETKKRLRALAKYIAVRNANI